MTIERAAELHLEIRLFAVARQRVGRPSLAVILPEGSTVSDLRRALILAAPEIADIAPKLMIAVDSEYAEDDLVIRPCAEVAVIPPVSGGLV